MLFKKDYERAAAIVVAQSDAAIFKNKNDAVYLRQVLCASFVAFFRGDNPKFDAARFREACGVE